MANYMKQVAETLGVELGEEFQIKYNDTIVRGTYRLTKKGTEIKTSGNWESIQPALLGILTGEYEIVKMPYQPKNGEVYWTYFYDNFVVNNIVWGSDVGDYTRMKCGLIFRTEAEAVAARPRVYKELTGKEWRGDDE